MKTTTGSLLLVAANVIVASAYAAQDVTVKNTPLPVTVSNPASSPVKTTIDAFPRTPVNFNTQLVAEGIYTVPDDKRLVIETISVREALNK